MSQQPHHERPTVKIRLNAIGRGTITIDDGPELPVRKLSIFSGHNRATVVRMDLVAVNVDAEMPVDEITEDSLEAGDRGG